MNNPHLADQLFALLQRQQIHANTLKQLLEQEQAQLLADQPDQLLLTIEQKESLAEQMATLQNQLSHLAQQHSGENREPSLVRLLQQCDPEGGLEQAWQALLETTRSCKQLNESNGSTINLKKRYADNGLAILRGQVGGNSANTYSKKGISANRQSGRILNKA